MYAAASLTRPSRIYTCNRTFRRVLEEQRINSWKAQEETTTSHHYYNSISKDRKLSRPISVSLAASPYTYVIGHVTMYMLYTVYTYVVMYIIHACVCTGAYRMHSRLPLSIRSSDFIEYMKSTMTRVTSRHTVGTATSTIINRF